MKPILSIAIIVALLTGCVSTSRYDQQQAELLACSDQAKQDKQAWDEQRANLETQLTTVTKERDACLQQYEQAQSDAQDIETRADELRQSLQEEIKSRNVEIETLKGKLSVRVLDRILFKSGSAEILPEGKAVLDKLASAMSNTQDYIRVEGHTDNVPIGEALKARYFSNWELSAARAASVVRFFVYAQKIDPVRLEAVGFSQYRPIATGDAAEDLQRNRRVEIVLTQGRE